MPPDSNHLNVIALISGGKDSLYSILHCIRNGHRVVALANLHPPLSEPGSQNGGRSSADQDHLSTEEIEEDMDSFMYQTIGHNIIPLYQHALSIPLYRGSITGGAVDTSRVYRESDVSISADSHDDGNDGKEKEEDETESLIPLLTRIKRDIRHANAVSAGAILSTYQRTRIENVAGRLGLVPLAYLWMYPHLPPALSEMGTNAGGLLDDMAAAGCDARIIKVASGGLDDAMLWENVSSADGSARRRIERSMKRFVDAEDLKGAVLGEGGEYETLALDGPAFLWKKRIVVEDVDRQIRSAGSGVSYVRIQKARCVDKEADDARTPEISPKDIRRPAQLDAKFQQALDGLQGQDVVSSFGEDMSQTHASDSDSKSTIDLWQTFNGKYEMISNITAPEAGHTADVQMRGISEKLQALLSKTKISTSNIVFTTVLLRSMQDFYSMNAIYVALFTRPNPPARVTVACGDRLPDGVQVMISCVVDHAEDVKRQGLHVQSRSYWAPANIGPYSQAITVPFKDEKDGMDGSSSTGSLVYIAGQIPLDPPSMEIPGGIDQKEETWVQNFSLHATLSLQHLWRIGLATQVDWWMGAIIFLARDSRHGRQKAHIASKIWKALHTRAREAESDDENSTLDAWDIAHGLQEDPRMSQGARSLPNFDVLVDDNGSLPPCFAVEVEELPRNSDIEWQALGTTGVPVSAPVILSSTDSRTTIWRTNLNHRNGSFYTIEVAAETGSRNLDDRIDTVLSDICNDEHQVLHSTIYTSRGQSIAHFKGQVVPCHTVWGSDGNVIAAAITVQVL